MYSDPHTKRISASLPVKLRQRIGGNSQALLESVIILGFSFFSLVGILHHEMWRDETQAWMLARDSHSLVNLFQNMSYEGHPALWHLCLKVLSLFTHNVLIVQLFHWAIAVGIITLITKYSPFSTLHKFLLSLSYFLFFEYALISRNYSIAILFFFLACAVYTRLGMRYRLIAVLLALAANANVYAFLMSIGLAIFFILQGLKQGDWHTPKRRWMTTSLVILGAGWLISGIQIIQVRLITQTQSTLSPTLVSTALPSPLGIVTNPSVVTDGGLLENIKLSIRAVGDILRSYVPFPDLSRNSFWNSHFIFDNYPETIISNATLGEVLGVFLSLLILGAIAYRFKQQPPVLWTYLIGSGLLILFKGFVYNATTARHTGHLFILFILCLWLFYVSSPTAPQRSPRFRVPMSYGLTALLCVQAAAGVYAVATDYLVTFSNGQAVAEFIQQNNLAALPIAGSRDRQTSVISGYLDTPIYYPERDDMGTFWTYAHPRIEDPAVLLSLVQTHMDLTRKNEMLLVLTDVIPLLTPTNLRLTPLAQFKGCLENTENFYLYTVQKS